MDLKPGDSFPATVGGIKTTLTVDKEGVLRFPTNKMYDWIFHNIKSPNGDPRYGGLNYMAIAYQLGSFSKQEYLEFYLNIGYSLSGFLSLSFFQDVDVELSPEVKEATGLRDVED